MLISLDVVNMFTNIPVEKTLKLIEKNKLKGYEKKEELIKVIQECLKQNYFRFNNKFYIQKKGLPMGSSMSPIMAEIYMNYFENKIMSTVKNKDKIKKWMRYVDDILLIWEGDDEELKVFFEEVNKLEESIKFKMEVGNKETNFLDLNIRITKENKLKFDIYRKSTYTDVIICLLYTSRCV